MYAIDHRRPILHNTIFDSEILAVEVFPKGQGVHLSLSSGYSVFLESRELERINETMAKVKEMTG